MTVFEMAKKYYPRLWDINRIKALYEFNKITEEEYNSIINDNEESK